MLLGFGVTRGRGFNKVYQNPQTRSSENLDEGRGIIELISSDVFHFTVSTKCSFKHALML